MIAPYDVRRLLEVQGIESKNQPIERTGHLGRDADVTLVSARELYVLYLATLSAT